MERLESVLTPTARSSGYSRQANRSATSSETLSTNIGETRRITFPCRLFPAPQVVLPIPVLIPIPIEPKGAIEHF